MMKRLIGFIICFITVFFVFIVPISAASTNEPDRESFEKQSVMTDIEAVISSDLIEKYKNGAGTVYTENAVIRTMEYGFYSGDLSDYGFYIYLYSPALNFGSELTGIKAQICLEESSSGVYKEYECTMLSKDGYFSKHRVELGEDVSKLNSSKRVYKISGVTAYNDSKGYLKDCKVGFKYTYTGNMQGYGSEIDTLSCNIFAQETLELETDFTYYRTASSEKGLYWQNQINTVYFSVPNKYINDYGKLSKIHHKYKEYKTGPMVVTNTKIFSDYMESLYSQNINAAKDTQQYAVSDLSFSTNTGLLSGTEVAKGTFTFNFERAGCIINDLYDSPFLRHSVVNDSVYKRLPFWFYDENLALRENNEVTVSSEEIFEFLNSHIKIFKGTQEELWAKAERLYPFPTKGGYWINDVYYEEYVDTSDVSTMQKRDRYINSFYTIIFSNPQEVCDCDVDLNDPVNVKNLLSYDMSHSWWDKYLDFGWKNTIEGNAYVKNDETILDIHPFTEIDDYDLTLSVTDFAKKYLVNVSDVQKIKAAYIDAKGNDSTLILFRFDISDYFAKEQTLYEYNEKKSEWKEMDAAAMVCEQSYYSGYDIISLTFDKDGVETVVPVVHDPKDFIADITTPSAVAPPVDWSALIGLVLFIVLIFIFRKPVAKLAGGIAQGTYNIGKGIYNGIRRFFKKE